MPLSEIARLINSSTTSESLTQTWAFTQDSFVHGMRITIGPRRLERHGGTSDGDVLGKKQSRRFLEGPSVRALVAIARA